jgi:hypothetical protein
MNSRRVIQSPRRRAFATKRIYVWGEIKYTDIFSREERFFRFYQWNGMEAPGKGWVLEASDKPQEAN